MRAREVNAEVFVAEGLLVEVRREDVEMLKARAAANPRKRARLCAHPSPDETVHEMLIVLACPIYIRPHKHLDKSESFHVIEGLADAAFFDDAGRITQVMPVGTVSSGRSFYYRLQGPVYHTVVLRSDFFVYHETTKGPFRRSDTVCAPWSPEEEAKAPLEWLEARLASFCGKESR